MTTTVVKRKYTINPDVDKKASHRKNKEELVGHILTNIECNSDLKVFLSGLFLKQKLSTLKNLEATMPYKTQFVAEIQIEEADSLDTLESDMLVSESNQ
jgi:hypothetical protein